MLRMSTAGTVLCLALAVLALPTSSAAATPANGLIAYSHQAWQRLPARAGRRDLAGLHGAAGRQPGAAIDAHLTALPSRRSDWSPDGAQIAYVSDTITGLPGLGDERQRWSSTSPRRRPRLRRAPAARIGPPDSTRLLFTRCTTVFNTYECAIVQVRADGTHLQPLTDGHHLDSSASWAPDLGILFFDSNRSNALSAIWRTTAAGPQRITPRSAEALWPDYRHDARASFYTDNCCRPHSRLHSMRADGTDDRTLTPGCFGAYSPDGARISDDGGINCNLGLTVANADGRNPVTIVATDQLVISDWGPRS